MQIDEALKTMSYHYPVKAVLLKKKIFSNLKDSKLHIHATGSLGSTAISHDTLDLINVVVKVTELIYTTLNNSILSPP